MLFRVSNDEVDISRCPIYNLVFSTLDDGSFLSLVQAKCPISYVHEHNAKQDKTSLCFKYPPDGINLIPYMPQEYFELPFKKVLVTLGATGRVIQEIRVYPSSGCLPQYCNPTGLPEESQVLLHEYFGMDITSDLKYLVYSHDNGLMRPSESVKGSLYHLLGKQFPDYPIMLVSPDARVHAVCDLQGNFRFVAIGKYDTYHRFIANGPSLWHNIPLENIQLEWNTEHIKPYNQNGQSTILSETIEADFGGAKGTSHLRPIVLRAVASKIKIATYPAIYPEESAKLQHSKNPFLAQYEDKTIYMDSNKKRSPSPEATKVRLCYNAKCQFPLTSAHRCPCRNAWYCNKNCQSIDWKAGHGLVCTWSDKKKSSKPSS